MQKKDVGITVSKDKDFSEWYTQVIQKGELADVRFGIQGFIVHRPWGFFIIKKIYEYLEEEIEKQGHQQFLFPISVKEKDLKRESEHAGFIPNVFWVTHAGDKKLEEKFALRPTGEAQIYPMYALWLGSYKDLPFKGYQDRIPVFRNEMTTRPFLRGREFLFFETHDVFYKHEDSLKQIVDDSETCKRVIHNKIKIPFQYFRRPQWDKFAGANDTFVADTLMPDGKRNQLASTHDLGQNFSRAYSILVKDKDGKEKYVWQTCFGPGIWRIMAALIAIHGDDNGLILPFDMAPLQVVIVPIIFKGDKDSVKILKLCKELKDKIASVGYRVEFDNSEETPGFKYNKWELKGVPIRIEIGPRDLKSKAVMTVIRTGAKRSVKIKDLEKELSKLAKKLDSDIKKMADNYFKGNTREVGSIKEVIEIIKKHRGFVKVPFCTIELPGKRCAEIIKAETEGADVCGTLWPKEEKPKPNQKCVQCGKKANHIVYLAKSY